MKDLSRIHQQLEKKIWQRQELLKRIGSAKQRCKQYKKQNEINEKAAIVIQEVSQLTQKEVEFRVSELVSHGLAAVFDDPYIYELKYIVRRDKTEADQFWKIGEHCYLPNGGGVRNVSSFALQIAGLVLSFLQKKGVRPILFLDEPFKGLKPTLYQERAGKIVQELANILKIQIVVITHDPVLSSQLDKTYKIKLNKGRISNAKRFKIN